MDFTETTKSSLSGMYGSSAYPPMFDDEPPPLDDFDEEEGDDGFADFGSFQTTTPHFSNDYWNSGPGKGASKRENKETENSFGDFNAFGNQDARSEKLDRGKSHDLDKPHDQVKSVNGNGLSDLNKVHGFDSFNASGQDDNASFAFKNQKSHENNDVIFPSNGQIIDDKVKLEDRKTEVKSDIFGSNKRCADILTENGVNKIATSNFRNKDMEYENKDESEDNIEDDDFGDFGAFNGPSVADKTEKLNTNVEYFKQTLDDKSSINRKINEKSEHKFDTQTEQDIMANDGPFTEYSPAEINSQKDEKDETNLESPKQMVFGGFGNTSSDEDELEDNFEDFSNFSGNDTIESKFVGKSSKDENILSDDLQIQNISTHGNDSEAVELVDHCNESAPEMMASSITEEISVLNTATNLKSTQFSKDNFDAEFDDFQMEDNGFQAFASFEVEHKVAETTDPEPESSKDVTNLNLKQENMSSDIALSYTPDDEQFTDSKSIAHLSKEDCKNEDCDSQNLRADQDNMSVFQDAAYKTKDSFKEDFVVVSEDDNFGDFAEFNDVSNPTLNTQKNVSQKLETVDNLDDNFDDFQTSGKDVDLFVGQTFSNDDFKAQNRDIERKSDDFHFSSAVKLDETMINAETGGIKSSISSGVTSSNESSNDFGDFSEFSSSQQFNSDLANEDLPGNQSQDNVISTNAKSIESRAEEFASFDDFDDFASFGNTDSSQEGKNGEFTSFDKSDPFQEKTKDKFSSFQNVEPLQEGNSEFASFEKSDPFQEKSKDKFNSFQNMEPLQEGNNKFASFEKSDPFQEKSKHKFNSFQNMEPLQEAKKDEFASFDSAGPSQEPMDDDWSNFGAAENVSKNNTFEADKGGNFGNFGQAFGNFKTDTASSAIPDNSEKLKNLSSKLHPLLSPCFPHTNTLSTNMSPRHFSLLESHLGQENSNGLQCVWSKLIGSEEMEQSWNLSYQSSINFKWMLMTMGVSYEHVIKKWKHSSHDTQSSLSPASSVTSFDVDSSAEPMAILVPEPAGRSSSLLKPTLLSQSQQKELDLHRVPSVSSLKKGDSGSETTSETASLDLEYFSSGLQSISSSQSNKDLASLNEVDWSSFAADSASAGSGDVSMPKRGTASQPVTSTLPFNLDALNKPSKPSISDKAKKFLDELDDLKFMTSTVLMFPSQFAGE